jgi:hypothetical protein
MNTETVAIAVSIAGVIATLLAIVFGFRGIRNQLWLSMFSEYAKRYAEIMDALPFEARHPGSGFDARALPDYQQKRFLSAIRNYLNLCSEEFWLKEKGLIDGRTWEVWTKGMAQVAGLPSFDFAWEKLKSEWDYFDDFRTFMDRIVLSTSRTNDDTDHSDEDDR